MASLITCTPAGTTDNSYIDLTDANSYFADTLEEEIWMGFSTVEREQALIQATKMVENLGGTKDLSTSNRKQFSGVPYSITQSLHFPRSGDIVGSTATIPSEIEAAVVEQAKWLLEKKTNPDPIPVGTLREDGVTNISLDGISMNWISIKRPSNICHYTWSVMRKYIDFVGKTLV